MTRFSLRKIMIACVAAVCMFSLVNVPAVIQADTPNPGLTALNPLGGGSPLPTPAPKPTTKPPAPKPSYCVAVVVRPTNFRTGPSTRYAIIRLLPTYTVLKAYARRGAWLSVADSRGRRGWVYMPNVRVSSLCARGLSASE